MFSKIFFDIFRFIPNRSAMDMDLASFVLMNSENIQHNESKTGENGELLSPSKRNYQRKMSEALNNGTLPQDAKILAFKQKAPETNGGLFASSSKCEKRQKHNM